MTPERVRDANGLRSMLTDIQAEVARISARPPDGRSATEIQFDQNRLHTFAPRCAEIQERLLRTCAERDATAAEFQQAWQRREALETLQRQSRSVFVAHRTAAPSAN